MNVCQRGAVRAGICKPFKEPRNRFSAWQNRSSESILGFHNRLHKYALWLSASSGGGCHQGVILLAVPGEKSPGSDLIGCLFCSGTRRCASPRKGGRRSPELCNLDLLNCVFKSKPYVNDVNGKIKTCKEAPTPCMASLLKLRHLPPPVS